MNLICYSKIIEENGKTIKENNREIKHRYPLGAIVTVQFDQTSGQHESARIGYSGTATLYVVRHGRDCDGTPLYTLADEPIAPDDERRWERFTDFALRNYGEEALTPTGYYAKRFYTLDEWIAMLRGE